MSSPWVLSASAASRGRSSALTTSATAARIASTLWNLAARSALAVTR
jgi:hypothetical protein